MEERMNEYNRVRKDTKTTKEAQQNNTINAKKDNNLLFSKDIVN